MKDDFSAGEVRGEACWGGAAEKRSRSILPSHRLSGFVCGSEFQNDSILLPLQCVQQLLIYMFLCSFFFFF